MPTSPQKDSPISRRTLLTGAGGTTVTGLAGCIEGLPGLGGPGLGDLPPFAEGYAAVRKDATVDVRLKFKGNVQQQIKNSRFDSRDLFTVDEFEFSKESVTIDRTPEFQEQQTVEGVIDGFIVTHSNWPGANWYITGLVSLSQDVPIVEDPQFFIRFPTGYQYKLPTAQTRVKSAAGVYTELVRADHRTLVSYGDETTYPKARTIPFIDHFDYPALVRMRTAAEYRNRLLTQMIPLFDWDTYANDAETALREGVSEIVGYLAENTVTSIVTAGIPSTRATASVLKLDEIRSIHEALTTEFTEFRSALESVESLTYASVNETWMSVLTPEGDETAGLSRLAELSRLEWAVYNPVLATAHDQDRFRHHLQEYSASLEEQHAITQRILTDSRFTDISSFGDDEWRQLKQRATELLTQLDRQIAKEQSSLAALRREFE